MAELYQGGRPKSILVLSTGDGNRVVSVGLHPQDIMTWLLGAMCVVMNGMRPFVKRTPRQHLIQAFILPLKTVKGKGRKKPQKLHQLAF